MHNGSLVFLLQDINKTMALEQLIPFKNDHTVLSPDMCKHQEYDVIYSESQDVVVGTFSYKSIIT